MARRKQKWVIGDVFAIGTRDGRFGVGQIIGCEAEVLDSVTIALFKEQVEDPASASRAELSIGQAFSLLFCTRESLDSGRWRVVCNRPVLIDRSLFPYESTRAQRWVGAHVTGSGIVNEFVDAYFGLVPWDDWHDPQYLDKLLLPSVPRPERAVLKDSNTPNEAG
jgi:hypothetical protein